MGTVSVRYARALLLYALEQGESEQVYADMQALVERLRFIPAIREALIIAKLDIPVVYNTNGYDSMEGLMQMEGLIDVYLPDLKYFSPDLSLEYSGAADYFEKASKAVTEMYRQVGPLVLDEDGIIMRGLIIRHLVLPGHINDTVKVLDWIAGNIPEAHVSLMSQYVPCHKACDHPVLGRCLTRYEYDKVLNRFIKLGLNGYVQERESASEQFIPDFSTSDLTSF